MTMIRLVEEILHQLMGNVHFPGPSPSNMNEMRPEIVLASPLKKDRSLSSMNINSHNYPQTILTVTTCDSTSLWLLYDSKDTLPETYIPPKNDGFQCLNLLFQESMFRGDVKLWECIALSFETFQKRQGLHCGGNDPDFCWVTSLQ